MVNRKQFDPSKMLWLYTVESSDGSVRGEAFQYGSGVPKIKLTAITHNAEFPMKNIPIDKVEQVEEVFELMRQEFDRKP